MQGRHTKKLGKRFGRLTVLSRHHKDDGGQLHFLCRCDCGNEVVKRSDHLQPGVNHSCGCAHRDSFKHLDRAKDITGQTFNKWFVVSRVKPTDKTARHGAKWLCRCTGCGAESEIYGTSLRSGHRNGCMACAEYNPATFKDIAGQKFGRLTVLRRLQPDDSGHAHWICLCDCGQETLAVTHALKSGNVVSCGCAHRDSMAALRDPSHPYWDENPKMHANVRSILGASYASWVENQKRRNVYRCSVSGAKNCTLVLHHINGWNVFPEGRIDATNVVVLSDFIHKDFHSKYGYGGNTREQWNEYILSAQANDGDNMRIAV